MSPIVDFFMTSLLLVLLSIALPTLFVAQCGNPRKKVNRKPRQKKPAQPNKSVGLPVKPAFAPQIALGQKKSAELNEKRKEDIFEGRKGEKLDDKKKPEGVGGLKEPGKAVIKKENTEGVEKGNKIESKKIDIDPRVGKKDKTEGIEKGNRIEPKKMNLDPKAQKIADTKARCAKGDYPTMNDVLSDWDSAEEKQKELAGGKKNGKAKEKRPPATGKNDFNVELKGHTTSKTPCGERQKQESLTDDEDDTDETLKNIKSLNVDIKDPSTIEE